jgi:4-hydroxy-tetrahydrodipicolinate synthase
MSPQADRTQPWHGVLVATALPFKPDFSVDFDAYADHVRWLAGNAVHGVCPNGSLGEYPVLTAEERARVVETAIAAAPAGCTVMPGVGAYGALESRRWAEQAAEAGAQVVMALPPNSYRADERAVLDHFREISKCGLPVTAYNNPIDTKTDLTPSLLKALHDEGLIVAVKEFSGDVRRAYQIAELAPGLDIMIGSDDVVLEVGIAGAKGWVAGYSNAFPRATVELYELSVARDVERALPLYRLLHPLLRWDSRTEFVQAIKLSMDIAGRRGGACRPPRQPLTPDQEAVVRKATENVLGAGLG